MLIFRFTTSLRLYFCETELWHWKKFVLCSFCAWLSGRCLHRHWSRGTREITECHLDRTNHSFLNDIRWNQSDRIECIVGHEEALQMRRCIVSSSNCEDFELHSGPRSARCPHRSSGVNNEGAASSQGWWRRYDDCERCRRCRGQQSKHRTRHCLPVDTA